MTDCKICSENEATEAGDDPWAVARLETGYVRLNPNQYFAGAAFFVAKRCVRELHDLDAPARHMHLAEMADVAAAIFTACGADKMNYEALGNGVPHLHWWLTPRRQTDTRPRAPIWEDFDFLRLQWTGAGRPPDDVREGRRRALLDALRATSVTIERAY
jgi:diadenosine tetraphosphate (Ap4A) HIT family hydrolase